MDVHLVKLINIHQQETSQIHLRVPLASEVQTVRIAEAQFGRKDDAAEGGFSITLRTYQQRRRTVGVHPVAQSPPVRHHIQKPAVEQFTPMPVVAGNQTGKRADAVFSVPTADAAQIFLDGIVQRHTVGSEVAVHVPVPYT